MPTLDIEGHSVEVDDSFLKLSPDKQQATVEEIAASMGIKPQQAPVSGLKDQFLSGFDQPVEDIGVSVQEAGKAIGSQGMANAGQGLRDLTSKPKDFVSAGSRFVNPQKGDSYVDPVLGYGWGNLPGAIAEQAGGYAGDLTARGAGAAAGGLAGPQGAAVGAFAGPALFEFIRQVGPIAKQRAQNDGREDPDWSDWTWAAGTAGVSGALNSIGIGKVGILNQGLKEVGTKTATQVVKEAAKETGTKALKEGATEAGQSVVEQYGSSAGTKTGAQIDLKQAVGEGVIGAGSAGTIDIARQARPLVRTVNDIRSVDSSIQNSPDARAEAEITRDANALANRPQQKGRELQSAEISSYVADLKNQAIEAIKGQKLEGPDKKALIDALNTAKGLTDDRLNQIAGRSESPSELQALVRKVQLVRSMTVQQQAHKGARGWGATAVRLGGPMAGAAIGTALLGPGMGSVAGAGLGQSLGRDIAHRLSASQTQGSRINALVGAKQARRAQMLLERYGPSEATQALNALTEKAAANKAQAEGEAQAKQDFNDTMLRIRQWQDMRKKSRIAEEKATGKEEKAKAAQERQKADLAARELRLKAMALKAANTEARTQRITQELEHKKSLNALTVEMTRVKQELQQKQAEAKAGSLDRQKQFEMDNLRGRMEQMSLDIQRRQEALKKAQAATARAQKLASAAPKSAGPTLARIRAMGSNWSKSVQADEGIANKPAYQSTVQYLDTLRQEAQNEIKAESNTEVRDMLRETLTDLLNLKNNWQARKERFARAMQEAKRIGGDAPQKLRDTLYQLANYSGQPKGREDYGTTQELPF